MAAGAGPVVVIGAGPAGAVAAYALASKGRDVLLVDAGRDPVDRIEMLPPSAIAAFEAAGLGRCLDDPSIVSPCLGIVRGRVHEDFLARPRGRGLAVHRPGFDAALRSAAIGAGAALRTGRVVGAAATDGGIVLTVSTGAGREPLVAPTVIDASGRVAAAARRLGGRIATLERLTAQRIAAPAGIGPWLSFAREAGGWRYAIEGPRGRVDAWRVGRPPGARPAPADAPVDASARILAPAAGARWIAIGDASAAFDPICAQGLAHAAGTAVVAAGMILGLGTVTPEAAEAYDAACGETARATEAGRRAIDAGAAPRPT